MIDTPRVRKQTRPFSATKDELAELSEGESDGDETKPKLRRNDRLNSYGRTECFRVEKNLLVYGYVCSSQVYNLKDPFGSTTQSTTKSCITPLEKNEKLICIYGIVTISEHFLFSKHEIVYNLRTQVHMTFLQNKTPCVTKDCLKFTTNVVVGSGMLAVIKKKKKK